MTYAFKSSKLNALLFLSAGCAESRLGGFARNQGHYKLMRSKLPTDSPKADSESLSK